MLTDKSKEDRLRRWTFKTVLSDFCGQSLIGGLILALVSLCLLVNSSKETFKEKSSDWFFIIILFKDILIILLFISRYFDYFIIICLFYLTEVTTWTIG